MGTLLLYLRPGYTFEHLGAKIFCRKSMYVSVKSFFVLFSVQLEGTWASKDAQAGFVTQCHGLNLLPNKYAVFKSRLISSARICY